MKLNKFKIFLLLVVSIVGISSIISYNSQKYSSSVNINNSKVKDNNMLGMMLETSAGSGEYKETTATSWPTDGYEFNETLSKCERGSKLSWDSTKKTVVMTGNNADKCYVYFNIKMLPLSDFIKSLYTNQGENNLYLHDSTLENGAGDGSYRYAGSSETTNNFVCFGYDSQDGSCPSDNLYRIIGVFGDEVKLIKYDYAKSTLLGTDCSSVSASSYDKYKGELVDFGMCFWSLDSLNNNYIENIGSKWNNKISAHAFQVGTNTKTNIRGVNVSTAYQNEIANPPEDTKYNAKVGLMYVSDYGYAAAQSSWTTTLNIYNNVISTSWMYMGVDEWTITKVSKATTQTIRSSGSLYSGLGSSNSSAARPTFYLNSNVTYVSGSGTKTSPYIIN